MSWYMAMRPRPLRDMLLFWCVTVLHLGWAGLLLIAPLVLTLATPVATLRSAGVPVAAGVLLGASCFAIWTLLNKGPWWGFLPQHILLILSAGDSFWAVLRGQYADGVERYWVFILVDQLPNLCLVVAYTMAMLEHVAWIYRVSFRTWPHWFLGLHLFLFTALLATTVVAFSAETRVTLTEMVQLALTETSSDVAVDRYRLGLLEAHMEEAATERRWIVWLLISNLVALVASMATFLVKSRFDRLPERRMQDRRES